MHRLILVVSLTVASAAAQPIGDPAKLKHYNISIAPLVTAIDKADALYSEWRAILDEIQAHIQYRQFHRNSPDAFQRAAIAVWKDREPPREWSVEVDPHMKQPLLDEIAALIADARIDLTLRGSTSTWHTNCNHCSDDGMCTVMACPYQRQSTIQITRAANSHPRTDDDLPLLPYLIYEWSDEKMRALWYCSTSTSRWGYDGCEWTKDAPPAAAA